MKIWRMFPLIIFVLLALFFLKGLSLHPQELPSVQIGKSLPDFELLPLQGDELFTSKLLRRDVALLNVWASWCAACVDEQVFLMDLSRKGIAIYGLNYKDKTSDALQWLQMWGNPYRAIGEDDKGQVAIDLGVYGAPETFLIDSHGTIQFRHVGALDEDSWNKEFLPQIRRLETKG